MSAGNREKYVVERGEGKKAGTSTAWIDLERANFQPGEAVAGKIHINLVSPAYVVFLTIKGKEKAAGVVNKKFKEKKLHILNEEIILNQLSGQVGAFTVPFVFRLPAYLPNSFCYKGPFCSFSIRYSLILQADSSRLIKNRIFVFQPRRRPPPIDKDILQQTAKKSWFRESRQDFELNAASKQYAFRETAQFEASCLKATKNANIGQMRGCLFLSMIGQDIFKGLVETVTRCEVEAEPTNRSDHKGAFHVPLIPLYWEQETEGKLFMSVYSLGVSMANTPFFRSISICLNLEDHIPNGDAVTVPAKETRCKPIKANLELCKEYIEDADDSPGNHF